MAEIKCPKCGEVFTVDESGYQAIVSQIRNKEFDKELCAKLDSLKKEYEKEKEITKLEAEKNLEKVVNALREENNTLKVKLDGEKDRISLEVKKALESEKENSLKKDSKILELTKDLEIARVSIKESYEEKLKEKDEQISFYKDLKMKLNNKMLGENLEQHCSIEFNKIRATAFNNAYFEKDNDAKGGSKGDFIFRDFDTDGTEIVSIMFEMKNEADSTATKHKNEDFFDKLDKDRKEKGCEYAVLVSMLEQESELYNTGILDVSYKHEKMYVIRPQFFIPLITMLRNANLKSLAYKKEVALIKSSNLDIEHFEENLEAFKQSFGKTYVNAEKKFKEAIDEIDNSIKHLVSVKEALTLSLKHLDTANKKSDDLTIKKLAKDSPSLIEKIGK